MPYKIRINLLQFFLISLNRCVIMKSYTNFISLLVHYITSIQLKNHKNLYHFMPLDLTNFISLSLVIEMAPKRKGILCTIPMALQDDDDIVVRQQDSIWRSTRQHGITFRSEGQTSTVQPLSQVPTGHTSSTQEPELANQCTSQKKKSKYDTYKAINLNLITNGGENKLMVTIPSEDFTAPVGKNAKYLGNYLGKIVRDYTRAPIRVWLSVKKGKEDMMWTEIMKYFVVSSESSPKFKTLEEKGDMTPDTPEVKQEKFCNHCFRSMGSSFHRWKCRLYREHYLLFETAEERQAAVPEGMAPNLWYKYIVEYEKENFYIKSEKVSKSWSNQVIISTIGSKSFCQKEYEMMDPETGEMADPCDVWEAEHRTKKNASGYYDPKSKEVYEKLKEFGSQPTQEGERPLHKDEIYARVLRTRPDLSRGRGAGYK
uniref:Uncharacterized protein LOC105042236 isoform X2 n=1 Tax=Elaeis guineensis var. tenera TaxID=51953 RepID=A0A8N4F256_ELAGV|nr:uncharacterized protein LOC105042236 isoform X2 [Elaeis guineensis]